jgi:hypothetical protein
VTDIARSDPSFSSGFDGPQRPPQAEPEGNDNLLEQALKGKWLVIVVCATALALVGVAIGIVRAPVYTAQADLGVGSTDLATQSLPGYVAAGSSLATSYSRIVVSPYVTDPVAKELGSSSSAIRKRLDATPIPESTVFTIRGQGDTPAAANRLTQAAVREIERRVQALRPGPQAAKTAFVAYITANRTLLSRQSRVRRLEARRKRGDAAVTQSVLERAQADVAEANLDARSSAAAYQQARVNATPATYRGVTVLTPANDAGSDRSAAVQRYGFIGLVGGALIGLLLAVRLQKRSNLRAVL